MIDRNVQFGERPDDPDWLPDRRGEGSTSGYADIAGYGLRLTSGMGSPGSLINREVSPGLPYRLDTHVEAHLASIMRQLGVSHATIRINNVKGPCPPCRANIGKVLPEGSSMTVEFFDRNGNLLVEVIDAWTSEEQKDGPKRRSRK
jgi:hypothetical protein